MGIRAGGMAAAGLLLMAAMAAAQTPETPPPSQNDSGVDVARLPVDLDRIGRKLQQARVQGRGLHFNVDVFAEAPPLLLFTPQDNLRWGPVPYGTPLHQEMMNVITPQHFRSPMMDFSSLLRWLNDQRRRDREQR
jgi:hypothetical protein